jgi:hypothetical protein
MTQTGESPREPLGAVLVRLRDVLQGQADALSAEDFEGLERLDTAREQIVAELSLYTPAETRPEDRALLEQVGALDERLITLARDSMDRTNQELRDVHRGRGALTEYQRRGQNLIRNLSRLDYER